jgi:hypothetical protein
VQETIAQLKPQVVYFPVLQQQQDTTALPAAPLFKK